MTGKKSEFARIIIYLYSHHNHINFYFRIVKELDTKVMNAAIFTINKEDHTLGNMIRNQLLKDPRVLFAGYKQPHPLEHKFELRVQTKSSEYTPQDALTNSVTDLLAELSLFEERFKDALKQKKNESLD
ncbi:DNA-directed RNA polymerase II subunit RPB11-like isoform X1 [Rhopalosiphum padi]|uniref:DNA-directed RNA polymerase II subunit RPB11-like isoform X1 n=1 Tax=Rhopalosiphum padi TaxID=40932 RepID=UPI00298D6521|nr:DNA-directed RNA polymerase II subunit RPB11-like isoform X1 [Rhopalosiphum padi]XP_060844453.1 DNA-directed RNA polymerase II subunit RPB11-like isoform X1 [Rhopalosiphum padi]